MGLVCRNGARECDGCGECKSEKEGIFCESCGARIEGDEIYGNMFYDILCLIKLHKN